MQNRETHPFRVTFEHRRRGESVQYDVHAADDDAALFAVEDILSDRGITTVFTHKTVQAL